MEREMYTLYTVYYARDTYTYTYLFVFVFWNTSKINLEIVWDTLQDMQKGQYIYTYTYSHLQGIPYPIINEHIQFDRITPVDSLSQQT